MPPVKSQASSYQKYVIEKQQVKQHFTHRTSNDSTTKFMISKILNGELENISTNSSNSNKAFVQNSNNNNGTKSSLKDEKAYSKVSFSYIFVKLFLKSAVSFVVVIVVISLAFTVETLNLHIRLKQCISGLKKF